MGKFFSAVLLGLACLAHAAPAAPQSGVRVGPEVEESAPNGPNGGAKKGEEKAPKPKEVKPAATQPTPAPTSAARPQPRPDATASAPNASAKGPTDAASDAPARPGPAVGIPVKNPGTGAEAAEGPAANNPPANKSSDRPAPTTNGANGTTAAPPSTSAPAAAPAPAVPLTSIYRIGVGDILDIRLLNAPDSRLSTLYTVLAGGLIEYPLVRDHVAVAGMTTDELAAQLVAELRHRGVYERPQVRVSVREYASHAVLISGLVSDPGTKILRREAVPLYVVVAEAQPKPEAGRAVVTSHATGKTTNVDLLDAGAMSLLVQAGDVITLTARPPEFFYIGGEINAPGQKNFHTGMTLTQALLASGGVTGHAGPKVKVLRQGPDGRLSATEFNLKEIEGGTVPDPAIQPGDRIEVGRGGSRK